MEAVTRFHLRALKRMDAATLEQISAADGSVTFSRVPEKSARIFISDAEYRLAGPNGYQDVAATTGTPMILRLVRLYEVEITAVAAEAASGMKFELYISPFEAR